MSAEMFDVSKLLRISSLPPDGAKKPGKLGDNSFTRFPSNPLMIRVPFFLLFNLNKETPKWKGQKGTTGVPIVYNSLKLPLSGPFGLILDILLYLDLLKSPISAGIRYLGSCRIFGIHMNYSLNLNSWYPPS